VLFVDLEVLAERKARGVFVAVVHYVEVVVLFYRVFKRAFLFWFVKVLAVNTLVLKIIDLDLFLEIFRKKKIHKSLIALQRQIFV